MLGIEPEIIDSYVAAGQVKIIFHPVLNHGDASVYATVAAECVGQQSSDLFWQMHKVLFENQHELWGATRDFYLETAVSIGADRTTFATCYDGPEAITTVLELDTVRRERAIYGQPIFVINDQIIAGLQQFDTFAQLFDNALNSQ